MHPLSRNYLILLLIFSLALIAGCSGSDPEPPAEPSAEPEAAALPDDAIDLILQGAFVVTMDEARRWRRNAARFRQLDDMARRLKRLEAKSSDDRSEKPDG